MSFGCIVPAFMVACSALHIPNVPMDGHGLNLQNTVQRKALCPDVHEKLSSLRNSNKGPVVISVFDYKYAGEAAHLANQLPGDTQFVGFCTDKYCLNNFTASYNLSPRGNGPEPKILDCRMYRTKVEPGVNKSPRCQGWRGIQIPKAKALDDMVHHVGVDFLLLDTDHTFKNPALLGELQLRTEDVVLFRKDTYPSYPDTFFNYGAFFVRVSDTTRKLFRSAAVMTAKQWDQAAFNYAMKDMEKSGQLKCALDLNGYASFNAAQRDLWLKPNKHFTPNDSARCGLQGLYHPDDFNHPICRNITLR